MLPISVEGHVGTSAHAPTGRVWVFSNEDSNLRMSLWGKVRGLFVSLSERLEL